MRRLNRYFAWSFLRSFGVVAFAIVGLIYLIETVELLRRLGDDGPAWLAPYMALLKMAGTLQEVFIVFMLFATMACLARAGRRLELVIARAAGRSVWQILAPILLLAAGLAALQVGAFTPIATRAQQAYERLETETIQRDDYRPLGVGDSGLWLRERLDSGARIIHARPSTRPDPRLFGRTTVFVLDERGRFSHRLDAARARLTTGAWRLYNVRRHEPGQPPRDLGTIALTTETTEALLRVHTRGARYVSFWALPAVIETFEASGLRAERFKLHFHRLAAQPLLAIGMALIGAGFTVRTPTRGGVTRLLAGGILAGLLIYVFAQMMFALGEKAGIPAALAAWTPAIVASLLGAAMVLHVENG